MRAHTQAVHTCTDTRTDTDTHRYAHTDTHRHAHTDMHTQTHTDLDPVSDLLSLHGVLVELNLLCATGRAEPGRWLEGQVAVVAFVKVPLSRLMVYAVGALIKRVFGIHLPPLSKLLLLDDGELVRLLVAEALRSTTVVVVLGDLGLPTRGTAAREPEEIRKDQGRDEDVDDEGGPAESVELVQVAVCAAVVKLVVTHAILLACARDNSADVTGRLPGVVVKRVAQVVCCGVGDWRDAEIVVGAVAAAHEQGLVEISDVVKVAVHVVVGVVERGKQVPIGRHVQ